MSITIGQKNLQYFITVKERKKCVTIDVGSVMGSKTDVTRKGYRAIQELEIMILQKEKSNARQEGVKLYQ